MARPTPDPSEYMVVRNGAIPEHINVPLTVHVKDGKLVNPGEGERLVVGEAVVVNGQVEMTFDEVPEELKAALYGRPGDFSFSLSEEREPIDHFTVKGVKAIPYQRKEPE